MAAADKPAPGNKIQTFVFFDLETTGLKGDNPRIVELSMIAVSRTHLLAMMDAASAQQAAASAQQAAASAQQAAASPATTAQAAATHTETTDAAGKTEQLPKLPRVLNKYSRLYYPCKLMNPIAVAINGLSNEILKHLPSFSEVSAQALTLFLDLPKPVSLVAHNGDRFDFPLLMAELTRVACVDTFTDLQCIDTLRAVKDIDALVESGKVHRILTYGNNNKIKFSPRLSYKQSDIYRRLFGREYAAHRAEADCEALLTICGHYGSRFVEWADTFATAFSVVEPMWLKSVF